MGNKKIKNATPLEYDNILFKSKLEARVYQLFKDAGFMIAYEPKAFLLFEGFNPTIPIFVKVGNTFKGSTKKVRDIWYTPDFIISDKKKVFIIETKGFPNDAYPMKEKMFRKKLENIKSSDYQYHFFRLSSLKDAKIALELIKNMCNETK